MWSFLHHYISESEAWILLPILAAVCVAVGSFLFLQSAVEKRATVTEAEKADWKRQLIERGKEVFEMAKLKAETDAAIILGHQQANKNNTTSQPLASSDASAAPTELRQRKGKAVAGEKQADAGDDNGMASDNDWELVDDERIERAEESQYEPPLEYQQAVEAFIEAMQELPKTAVDELQTAVSNFFNVMCSLLDGSSHITPLPSTLTTPSSTTNPTQPPPASTLSPSARYATRNVLLSRLVDTQSLHALHEVAVAHAGTALAADAEHLHQLLVPVLHSH